MQIDERGYVRLRPDLQVVEHGNRMLICGDETSVFHNPPDHLRLVLNELAGPTGVLGAKLRWHRDPAVAKSLAYLAERQLLQTSRQCFSATRAGTSAYFDSTLGLPDAEQRLNTLTIAIVGCGGIGGELARHLAASGVRGLVVLDDDIVAEANLNRQYLFTLDSLGRPKVEAAKTALRALCRDVNVMTVQKRVVSAGDLACLDDVPLDAIVCCADMPIHIVRRCVSEYAAHRQLWFSCASVGLFQGQWGPVIPPGAPPYHDWPAPPAGESVRASLAPIRASFGPTNSIIAAFLARDVIHALLGGSPPSLNARCRVHFENMQMERFSPEAVHGTRS